MAIVLTDSKNYEDIADAIREKLGTTETYKPGEMPAAIESISGGGGGGSLDYTVTFKDEDGETQAIYTVKDGVGNIAKPTGIEADSFKDESGNAVSFPLTPTSDLILTADNSSLSSRIYACQGVSPSSYIYVKVGYAGSNLHICFCNSTRTNENAGDMYFPANSKIARDVSGSGASNILTACEYFASHKVTLQTYSSELSRGGISSKAINSNSFTGYSNMDTL